MNIYPNAYYTYRKHRNATKEAQKHYIQQQIQTIYHAHKGGAWYRRMRVYLASKGIYLFAVTVHKYMKELALRSVVQRKPPTYQGTPLRSPTTSASSTKSALRTRLDTLHRSSIGSGSLQSTKVRLLDRCPLNGGHGCSVYHIFDEYVQYLNSND